MTDQDYRITGDLTIKIDTMTDQRGVERTIRAVRELGLMASGGVAIQTLGPDEEAGKDTPEVVDPRNLKTYLLESGTYQTEAAATSQATRLLHSFSAMCESIIRSHQGRDFDFPMEMVVNSAGSLPSFATLAHFVDYVENLSPLQRPHFFLRTRGIGARSHEVLKGYVESKHKSIPVQE